MDYAKDLIYWREPIKSGIFMVVGLTLLISLSCLSLVSIVAYAGLALLCCTAGHRMYCFILSSSKLGQKSDSTTGITTTIDPFGTWINADVQLPREKIASRCAASSAQLNAWLQYVHDMILLKNYFDTFQFIVLLYFLSVVGGYFNLLTLVTIAFTMTMTLPKVYIIYQPQLDSVFSKVKKHANDVYTKIQPIVKRLRGAGQRT